MQPLQWIAVGVAMLLFGVQEGEARLQPYYVIRNATDEIELRPRILFVLDTSGSMSTRARPDPSDPAATPPDPVDVCEWDECENPTLVGTDEQSHESRMAAARRAVNQVITTTGDAAKFALMTFDQNDPHTSYPVRCQFIGTNQRFLWIDEYRYPGPINWEPVEPNGYQGSWRLCQGPNTRPYPYLRWDNLGVGSVIAADSQVGDVPASPLISTDYDDLSADSNALRRVQWFPEFMGVRFQPNDTTDPSRAITHASVGDFGNAPAIQDIAVWGHDFYYWPYVDGFPGYGHWYTRPEGTGENTSGVVGVDNLNAQTGKLFAPFYFDFTDIAIPLADQGPETELEARDAVLTHTSPLIYGGVDAVGYTPWASTIGPIPVATTLSNATYAHSTVSSYLAFVNRIDTDDSCAPTAAVLITDGEPYPAAEEGGPVLYDRLASLRRELGIDVYTVGFFLEDSDELNDMACAGAGACDGLACDTPCDDAPTNAWDTCADPDNPATNCAFLAGSADQLQQVLVTIIEQVGTFDVPSGPGSTANEFGVSGGGGADDIVDALQTTVSASTDFPSWRGHVTRALCDFRDPDTDDLLPQCTAPPGPVDEIDEETFGPCPQSRSWDAGECLTTTPWNERRIYTNDSDNQLVLVANEDGSASAGFIAELSALELIEGADAEDQADEISAFLLGRDAPASWKLPGLANSAPIIVRRIPPFDPDRRPSVAITDPHCGGRLLGAADGVPPSLEEYAEEAWEEVNLLEGSGFGTHYEAQEAVIIGDDFGVLHAFQLNSGNELWGFIPRFLLESLRDKSDIGASTYGQAGELADHSYGLAATINRGWVYDDRQPALADQTWRQLAILGMGAGGTEYMVLDLSHMSPISERGPFEIMWTTEDAGLEDDYDEYNGETWTRPALGYHVPGDISTQTPDGFFVMGSGYPVEGAGAEQGRTLLQVDALTGEIVDRALLPAIGTDVYEPSFGAVVDNAISTHCLSRLWAEMQEVYIADPAGRLFRWDLGRETDHAADSGGVWGTAATMATAAPIPSCMGAGDSCSVDASNTAEPFTFPPAVTSNDRLDDITSISAAAPLAPSDQFLLAMIGGAPANDALHSGDGLRYHSSLFILVDDHSEDASEGFDIPVGAPSAAPGEYDSYMRMALTDLERTRTILPYPGADEFEEIRNFSRQTRPIRAPRIFITGVVDESTIDDEQRVVIAGVEVYFLEFTVYEPPQRLCDPTFFEPGDPGDPGEWYEDPGSTYVITFRLTADVSSGFDLINGADSGGGGGDADFGDDFDTGLTLVSVEQTGSGDCADGGCGALLGNPTSAPCDNNAGGSGLPTGSGSAISIGHKELSAFTPIE